VKNRIVKLQIWDTAGQEKFRAVTRSYYRKADGAVLVYDVTKKKSLRNLLETEDSWLSELERKGKKNVAKIIVGARADLVDDKEVTVDVAESILTEYHIDMHETSSKTGAGVDAAFRNLAEKLVDLYPHRGAIHTYEAVRMKQGNDADAYCCS